MEPSIDPAQLLEHAGWMKGLARSLVGEDQADDVVQQTWLTMLNSPAPRPATTVAWLATVVRRLAYRTQRKDRRRRDREQSVRRQEMTSAPPDSALQRAELQRLLVNTVLDLDEPYRSTVILRYFEALSVKTITERQGVSADTVKTRLRRALAKLREKLDRAHGDGRRAWIALLGPLACGPAQTTATAAAARDVSTTATEATRASRVARSIIAGGIAVSVKKVTVVIVGALLTVGLGGILLWSPPEPEAAKSRTSSIESSSDLTVAENEGTSVDATPTVAVASETENPPQQGEETKYGTIHGRAIDKQGVAVAGVRARVFRTSEPGLFKEETVLEGDTVTTEIGEFEFAALPIGTYVVRAISNEHRPSEVHDLELTDGALLEVDLEVQRGLAIAGIVVDPHGRPVAGATVTSTMSSSVPTFLNASRDLVGWAVEELAETTGEGGRFRITRLPSGNRRLVIRHPDWMVAEHIVASGSHDVRITVRSGVTLRGRVVNASRQPVPRASVIVDRWLERGFDPSYKTGAHVTTDEEGLFRAEHVTPGRFQLKVEAEGFPPLETNAIEVRAGELLEEFELVLAAVAEVTGTLVDPSGAAVEGVDVKAITAGGQLTGAATTTDHAGHFVLSPLENETEYQLSFRHPEFARRRRDPIITEGETTDLGTFTLEAGSTLSGEVVDATGAALPLAKVLLQHRQGDRWSQYSPRPKTAIEGRFEFPSLGPGEYRVQASASGFMPAVSEAVPLAEGEKQIVRAELGRGLSLQGRVVDDRGRPVPRAEVVARQKRVETRAITDSDGRFAIQGLEDDELRIGARTHHLAAKRFRKKAQPGDTVEIVLHRTARLSGTVRDRATGEPLAVFRVYLAAGPRRSHGGGTQFRSPLGRYVLDDLEPRGYLLRILAPGYVFREMRVELTAGDDRELDVELTQGQTISGRLVDRSGEAVAGARVFPVSPDELGNPIRRSAWFFMSADPDGLHAENAHHPWAQEVRTDPDGRFILAGMPPGPTHLRVEQGTTLFEDLAELDVPERNERGGVDLGTVILQRGSILEGVVFDASGEPLRAGSMTIRPLTKDGTEHGSKVYFQIGEDGRFRRTGLGSGSYRIRLFGHEGFDKIVELGVDEMRQVEFHVPLEE